MEIQQPESETMPSNKNKDYLEYFPRGKKSTKQSNASGFKKFCLWANKTPNQLIQEYDQAKSFNNLDDWERETTNSIIEFYKWLQKQTNPKNGKVYSSNYCNNVGSSVLSFYHQNCRAIEKVMDSFNPTQMPKNEYRFSQDDLRNMYHFGDVEEKALISLAVSYGQGSKDFLNLKAQKLREIIDDVKAKNQDFAMWIGDAREKTGISPVSFLTPEAIESVDAYLKLLKNKHGKLPEFLWCSNRTNKHISNEGLNKKLRRLVIKANINVGKKNAHFHCIRKFTFSRLRRIDKDIAKIICGKSVSVSDMTYEEIEDQAEKVFRLAYKNIALNGDLRGKNREKQQEQIDNLQNAVVTLNRDLQGYKITAETLNEKFTKINEKNQVLKQELKKQKRELQEQRENIIDYSDKLDLILRLIDNPEKVILHEEIKDGKLTGKVVAITATPLTKEQLDELEKENQE